MHRKSKTASTGVVQKKTNTCENRKRENPDRESEISQLIDFKKKLPMSTHGQFDKNNGKGFVRCAMGTWLKSKEMWWDNKHYVHLPIEQHEALSLVRARYKKKGFSEIVKWKKDAKLPNAYDLPKNKDWAESRPVTSYFHAGPKKILNMAGRALAYLLDCLPITYRHFNLSKTKDFKERIMKHAKELRPNANSTLEYRTGDVKKMYTELPHAAIMAAVIWLLQIGFTSLEKNGFNSLLVKRSGKRGVTPGNRRIEQKHKNPGKFTAKLLESIVHFDLNNCFFHIGNFILLQIIGIGMGSPISPVIAVVLCAHSEVTFMRTLGLSSRLLRGTRYVDDVFLLYRRFQGAPSIDDFWKLLQTQCYPRELQLEETGGSPNPAEMLESILSLTNEGDLEMNYLDKNAESIREKGKQKFLKMQPRNSFTRMSAKKSTMYGALLRMADACSNIDGNAENFMRAAEIRAKEFKLLGYTNKTFMTCLNKVLYGTRKRVPMSNKIIKL